MPPAQGHPLLETVDGRHVITMRQSWVNDYLMCPERARRQWQTPPPRTNNDAAAIGTALHATIEDSIRYLAADHILLSVADHLELLHGHWQTLLDDTNEPIRWVKRQQEGARRYGERMVATFACDVLPSLAPHGVEISFGPLPLIESDDLLVQITGTIDYVDTRLGLVDWKSASRMYEPWEKQRWAIQPTFYQWAWTRIAPSTPNQWTGTPYEGPMENWSYIVFPDNTRTPLQVVPLHRGAQHHDWLRQQLMSIADQIIATAEGHLVGWPLNDQHALCSAKWCPFWDACKGALLWDTDAASGKPATNT